MAVRGKLILDVAIFVAYLVATDTALTGIPIHEWLSLGVAVAIAAHAALNWDLTVGVVRRFVRHMLSLSRLNLVVDAALFVVFVAVMLSGLLVSDVVMPALGIAVPFGPMWRILHSLTAMLALPVLGVHVGLHARWLVSAFRRVSEGEPEQGRRTEHLGAAMAEDDRRIVAEG